VLSHATEDTFACLDEKQTRLQRLKGEMQKPKADSYICNLLCPAFAMWRAFDRRSVSEDGQPNPTQRQKKKKETMSASHAAQCLTDASLWTWVEPLADRQQHRYVRRVEW
jgi:hypothetical protein